MSDLTKMRAAVRAALYADHPEEAIAGSFGLSNRQTQIIVTSRAFKASRSLISAETSTNARRLRLVRNR